MSGTKKTSVEILLQLRDKLSGPLNSVYKQLEKAREKTEALRRAFENVASAGKKMVIVGAALAAGLAVSGRAYAQDETSLLKMKTAITGTASEVQEKYVTAVAAAREWTARHGDSIDEWSNAAYRMQAIGLQGQSMIEGTNVAMQFAKATFGDASTAANILTISYDNFGDKTKVVTQEMSRLADQLTATQQAYNIADLNQLAAGFQGAVGAANSFGVELAQTLGVLGQLNNKGVQGAEAGTMYAASLNRMNKAAKEFGFEVVKNARGGTDMVATLQALREKLGPSATWTAELRQRLNEAFGEEYGAKISLLTDNVDQLATGVLRVNDSLGLTTRTSELMESGLEGAGKKAWRSFKNLLNAVIESLAPAITRIAERMAKLANAISEFAAHHPTLMKFVSGALVGATALLIFGGATLWAIGSVGRLVVGFVNFLSIWPVIRNWLQLGSYLIRSALIPALRALGTAVAFVGRSLLSLFLNPVGLVILAIVAYGVYIYMLIKHFDKVKAYLQGVPGWLVYLGAVLMPALGVPLLIIKYWDKLKGWWTSFVGWWRGSGESLVDTFVAGIKAGWGRAVETVKALLMRLRRFFWGSDPREGPMAHTRWMGSMLPATLARGVEQGSGALLGSLTNLLDRSALTVRNEPPRAVSRGGGAPGARIGQLHVQINTTGGVRERDVERALLNTLNRHSFQVGRA